MKIAADTVVTIHYILKNDAGDQLESSHNDEPLAYLHGHHNLIVGLEKELADKEAGTKLSVTVAPEEAYGVHEDGLIEQVPKEMFGEGTELEVGMQFHAQSQEGHPYVVRITSIDGDMVEVDGNHPFAGETLHFDVEVLEVREATAEEMEHGHAHGAGGHQH